MTEYKKNLFANRASFLVAGFCIAAWAPMIPFIKDRFALDEHNLGLLLLCLAIGSFVSMPTSGYLSSRFGCKAPIYAATAGVAACLSVVPLIHNIYLLALVLFIMGICAVALDVISNINAALIEQISKRNIMSGLHGLYSVGGFCGSLSVTFLLGANLSLEWTGIYAAVVLLIVIMIGGKGLYTSVYTDEHNNFISHEEYVQKEQAKSAAQAKESGRQSSKWQYYTNTTVLLIGLMCFIMFMTEGSMLDWSGVFLNTERGISLENAGYGYASFAIMMTICRLTGDKIVSAFGRGRVLIFSTLFIVAGYFIAVLIPHYIAAFVGFALIGVGASNVVPQLVSISARVEEVPSHIAVTLVNTIGFTGMLVGPALIGFLAHAITLHNTYLCQAGGVLIVTFLSVMLVKKHRQHMSLYTAADAATTDTAAVAATDAASAAAASADTQAQSDSGSR